MKTETRRELRRDLGTWPAMSIVIGTVIGSGIFLVPKHDDPAGGVARMVFLVWVFGGLLSLSGALSYAELAAAMPEAGGEYVFLREAYGPHVGLYLWLDADVGCQKRLDRNSGHRVFLLPYRISSPALDTVFYTLPLPSGPTAGRSNCARDNCSPSRLILLLGW